MEEIRKHFHEQLQDIADDIRQLGGMVTELIPRGTEILLDGDLKAAEELIRSDDVLDALALKIDDQCCSVLALQNPVASDLRAIVSAIHLVSEIERSGDLVTNIAKGTRRMHGHPIDPKLRGYIERMGNEAARLFRAAIDSYVDRDEGLASALPDMDDTMDKLHADYIEALFESRHAGDDLASAVQLALIGRYYERIGDHAVNIAERVVYLVTGLLPEHTGAARVAPPAGAPTDGSGSNGRSPSDADADIDAPPA